MGGDRTGTETVVGGAGDVIEGWLDIEGWGG